MNQTTCRIRGREITSADLETIREVIASHWSRGRSHISRVLCERWDWRQPNGWLKDRACRDVLLRLEAAGLIELPPRRREKANYKKFDLRLACPSGEAQTELFFDIDPAAACPSGAGPLTGLPGHRQAGGHLSTSVLEGHVTDYGPLAAMMVRNSALEPLWDAVVQKHHYLGCPTIVGSYLKYLIYLDGTVAACLGWGSAAWKVRCRDEYIGWTPTQREERLCHVVNNVRFLILPWVRVTHFASKALSLGMRQVAEDWPKHFGYPVYLLETFVDTRRFRGTCYKATNWRYLGHTRGSAKRGAAYVHHGHSKAVFVYPLVRNVQQRLADD
jgi:hypothetical protein